MKKPKFDLSIIILNHNTQFWLKKVLESLKKNYLPKTKYQIQIIVVDNASSDGSKSLVKKSFRSVELIELQENMGFATGNNAALKTAQNTSRFVMLLNSDTELDQDSNLDVLLDVMIKRPEIAVITPKLIQSNGEIDPASHRGEPTLWASFSYFLGLENLFPHSPFFAQYHQTYKNLETIHPIDACSGAAMLVRTSAIKRVGLLDERFFMYAEDLDWCKRFREAGYIILYYPLVTLIHHKYKSGIKSYSGPTSNKTTKYFYDTMLQYFGKHYAHQYPNWVRKILAHIIKFKKFQKGVI